MEQLTYTIRTQHRRVRASSTLDWVDEYRHHFLNWMFHKERLRKHIRYVGNGGWRPGTEHPSDMLRVAYINLLRICKEHRAYVHNEHTFLCPVI